MGEPNVRHSYVKLNNSLTHLVQYGGKENFVRFTHPQSCLETKLETISGRQHNQLSISSTTALNGIISSTRQNGNKPTLLKRLIVFVPGNPGILGVYHDFLVRLYKTVVNPSDKSSSTPIIGISHNDFDHPDSCSYESGDRICIGDNDLNFVEQSIAKEHKPYDVELQVLNKLIILKKLFGADPNRFRVVFIGHSIGCYIILRLLQDKMICAAHSGSVLIHPALENLSLTEKGAKISRYFDFKLDLALRLSAYICELILTRSLRLRLTKWFCSPEFVESSSDMVIESIAQLGCSHTVKALVEMAKSEFERVHDIDHEMLIKPHADKLKLIYALEDGWVNVKSREELRNFYPSLHIEEQPTLHAFMMDPQVVAEYVIKIGTLVQDCFDDERRGT